MPNPVCPGMATETPAEGETVLSYGGRELLFSHTQRSRRLEIVHDAQHQPAGRRPGNRLGTRTAVTSPKGEPTLLVAEVTSSARREA